MCFAYPTTNREAELQSRVTPGSLLHPAGPTSASGNLHSPGNWQSNCLQPRMSFSFLFNNQSDHMTLRTLLKIKSHNIYAGTVQGKQNVCMATLTTSTASLSLDVRCDFKDVFLGTFTLFWPSSCFPCPQSRKLLFHTLGYIWTCSHMCSCSFSKQSWLHEL